MSPFPREDGGKGIYRRVDVQITNNILRTGGSVTHREVGPRAYWIIPRKSMYHLSASLIMPVSRNPATQKMTVRTRDQ